MHLRKIKHSMSMRRLKCLLVAAKLAYQSRWCNNSCKMGRIDDNPHQALQHLTAEEANEAVPNIEEIPPFKNKETWWFPPEQDEDGIFWFIKILECPCHEDCDGSPSFKNASIWSFHGHLSCYSYLMHHLTESSKHNLAKDEAYAEILAGLQQGKIKFEACEWSGTDRKAYREDVRVKDEHASNKRKKDHRRDEGKRQRGDDDNAPKVLPPLPEGFIERIVKEAAEHTAKQMASGSVAASSGSGRSITSMPAVAVPSLPNIETVPVHAEREMKSISLDALKTIQDRMVRAEHAVSTAFIQCCAHARKLETERQIIMKQIEYLAQFTGEEPKTMSSSKGNITLSIGSGA